MPLSRNRRSPFALSPRAVLFVSACLALAAWVSPSSASIVSAGFNNNLNTTSDPALNAAITVNGLGFSTASKSEGTHSLSTTYANIPTYDSSTPLASTVNMTLTIDPVTTGATFNLSALTFFADSGAPQGTGDTGTIVLAYDNNPADGYNTFVTTALPTSTFTLTSRANNSFTSESVTLTDPAFQNLSGIAFKFFWNDGGNASSSGGVRLDNLKVEGTPEPTSAALLGIAGFAALHRRRRAK